MTALRELLPHLYHLVVNVLLVHIWEHQPNFVLMTCRVQCSKVIPIFILKVICCRIMIFIVRAMQLAKEAGLQICLDMASYNVVEAEREFFDMLITKYVDIVFANESEARAYTGKGPEEALQEISSKCSIVVIKTGKSGSLVKKGTEVIRVNPFPVKKVVDTTGAGDFYAAGFLYGLTCGYSLEKCAQISSILAGYVIQTVGTALTKKKWNEIKLNIESVLQA